MSDIESLKELLAKTPCETQGAEDLEPGCCGPCRARAELASLQSKLAEAERALEPFAKVADLYDDSHDEDGLELLADMHIKETRFTVGQCRFARTTLATIREEEPLPAKQGEE